MVAGALFELQAALESLNAGNTRGTVAKLDTAMQVIRDLDNANRMVMEAAYPSLLNKKGLVSALKYSIKGLNSQFDGSCGLVVKGNPARITQQQELALFRIAQEGVTNALKHAQAKTVSLSLEFYDGRLVMRIYDDGRGFSQRKRDRGAVPHRGIIGIKDRAAAINASLELLSAAGEGTQITVELAYEAAPGAPAAPTSTAPKSSVQA
jgi:signal transduction histidine kinase